MSISRLTLGTAQLGSRYGIANRLGQPKPDEVDAILRTAFDLEIRSLDTAAEYGESEAAIGRFLRREGRPDGLRICGKLPLLESGLSARALDRAVADAASGSCQRLGAEKIDDYLVHSPANLREYGRTLVAALLRCREAGWVERIGVSVYGPEDA